MNEFGVGVCSVDGLLVLLPKGLMTGLVLSLQLQKKVASGEEIGAFFTKKPWLRKVPGYVVCTYECDLIATGIFCEACLPLMDCFLGQV